MSNLVQKLAFINGLMGVGYQIMMFLFENNVYYYLLCTIY